MASGRSKSSQTSWTSSRSPCQVGAGRRLCAAASVQAGLLHHVSAFCFEKRRLQVLSQPEGLPVPVQWSFVIESHFKRHIGNKLVSWA